MNKERARSIGFVETPTEQLVKWAQEILDRYNIKETVRGRVEAIEVIRMYDGR